jgi:hypothetical protein
MALAAPIFKAPGKLVESTIRVSLQVVFDLGCRAAISVVERGGLDKTPERQLDLGASISLSCHSATLICPRLSTRRAEDCVSKLQIGTKQEPRRTRKWKKPGPLGGILTFSAVIALQAVHRHSRSSAPERRQSYGD